MDVTLVMFKADGSRRDFPIRKNRIVVGRKNSCGLRIPIPAISRQHCEIEVTPDGIVLRDLGSSNGTYHNSLRVQESELTAGDEVSVGPVVFTVVVNGRPAEIRPVRTLLDRSAAAAELENPVDEGPAEIADLSIDDDADLARELSDELASADLLATPSMDEPPAAGLEDSDLDMIPASGDAGLEDSDLNMIPASGDAVAALPDANELDLDALFSETAETAEPEPKATGAGDDASKRASSSGANASSSILDFDFDDLDEI